MKNEVTQPRNRDEYSDLENEDLFSVKVEWELGHGKFLIHSESTINLNGKTGKFYLEYVLRYYQRKNILFRLYT